MESHRIIESLEEIEFYSGWESLKQYLSMMESYLKDTREEFINWSKAEVFRLPPEQRHEFSEAYIEDLVNYYEEFPRILRNSFLISVISLLEHEMGRICGRLKKERQVPISWSDLRGNVFERVKLYCKLAGLPLSFNNLAWQEIDYYYLVRNCIVHNRGFIKGSKSEKKLLAYATRKNIAEKLIIFPEVRPQALIALTEQFSKDVVENIEAFFVELEKNINVESK